MTIALNNKLRGRFHYWLGHGQSWVTGQAYQYNFAPYFANNTLGNPAMGVNELVLTFELGGEVIATWDLTPHLIHTPDGQGLSRELVDLPLSIGNDQGELPNFSYFTATLTIRDNLGITYEQRDRIFISHTPLQMGRTVVSGQSVIMEVPAPTPYFGWHDGTGGIRIVN